MSDAEISSHISKVQDVEMHALIISAVLACVLYDA